MEEKPEFDADFAESLIGKYVLVGLTYLSKNGGLIEQVQKHGTVKEASEDKGICIELRGNEAGADYWLPPDLRCFQEADRGQYRLRSTGEVIADPDYTCSWTITKPD